MPLRRCGVDVGGSLSQPLQRRLVHWNSADLGRLSEMVEQREESIFFVVC